MSIAADEIRYRIRRAQVMRETERIFGTDPIPYKAICDGCGKPIEERRAVRVPGPHVLHMYHWTCAPTPEALRDSQL